MHASPLVEVCIDSVAGLVAARDGGADRVELCDNLVEGGTTPSAGAIELAQRAGGVDLVVMIRPRGGDFLYTDLELEVMKRDIEVARQLGAGGIAVGVLTADGAVDETRLAGLIAAARPMKVTFHRAFDMTRDPFEAFESLRRAGVDRILTSGAQPTAPEGAELIRALLERAAAAGPGGPAIMPGGGVREHNIRALLGSTGAREVHFSAGEVVESAMRYRSPQLSMGGPPPASEYERKVTSLARVKAYIAAARG